MNKFKSNATCKKITFSSDRFILRGTLHLPLKEKPPAVIGCHGLLSSSNSPKQIQLATKCATHGIAFFRFDHRGCGQSSGIFKQVTSLEARCNDLISAIDTIRARQDVGDCLGLFGSSMGGAVCLSVAATHDVDSLVTFAAPVRSGSITFSSEKSEEPNGPVPSFHKNNLQSDISGKLSSIKNILILHGDSDDLVPPSNAREIYEKTCEPKKLIMQKNGDHRMSNEKHQKTFLQEAVLWYQNYLNPK
jgi:alpha-beta hydrolase superfamily lysophospholipase